MATGLLFLIAEMYHLPSNVVIEAQKHRAWLLLFFRPSGLRYLWQPYRWWVSTYESLHPHPSRPKLILAVSKIIFYYILEAFYNVTLHPLKSVPGPRWAAASRLSYTVARVRGRATHRSKNLHDKYGHVVRIAPDILSFTTSQAWVGQSPGTTRSFIVWLDR